MLINIFQGNGMIMGITMKLLESSNEYHHLYLDDIIILSESCIYPCWMLDNLDNENISFCELNICIVKDNTCIFLFPIHGQSEHYLVS